MGRSRRTIPEELLLLALDPTTGTTAQPQSLDLGVTDLKKTVGKRLEHPGVPAARTVTTAGPQEVEIPPKN